MPDVPVAAPAPAAAPAAAPSNGNPNAPPGAPPTTAPNTVEPTPAEIWEALKSNGHSVKRGADGKVSISRKLKVDGAETDFDLLKQESWNDVTSSKTAKRMINEAGEVKRAWLEIVKTAGADLPAAIDALVELTGKSPTEARAMLVKEELRRAQLTPAEKDAEELKLKVKRYEEREQEQLTSQQQQQRAQARGAWESEIQHALVTAGAKDVGPQAMADIAGTLITVRRNMIAAGTWNQQNARAALARIVAPYTAKSALPRSLAYLDSLSDDELVDALGDTRGKRFLAARAKREEAAARAGREPPKVPAATDSEARAAGATAPPTNGKKVRMSEHEKRAKLASLTGGKNIRLP